MKRPEKKGLDMVEETLMAMRMGRIMDSTYTVDPKWLVPPF